MKSFETLYETFEKTKDICLFTRNFTDDETTRFFLIRSLDKKNLEDFVPKDKIEVMMKTLYNTKVSNDDLLCYVKSKRKEIDEKRTKDEMGLSSIIKEYGRVQCGLRNDKVDDLVKALVRDKSIKSVAELNKKIDSEIIPRIEGYIRWSFYNQVTNDLIEHYFIRHATVVPTLRKIHDIDFFIERSGKLIPFDLKITHIADDCFDILSKNIRETNNQDDLFSVDEQSLSESDIIKERYRRAKAEYNLPNYSGLSKRELVENIESVGNTEADAFVKECKNRRKQLIKKLSADLRPVEWWNYKFQGERLFCNNNRFFVFMAYENSFEDGRPIKGQFDRIGRIITEKLNGFSDSDIHDIRYYYDKDRSLAGNYRSKSTSVLLTE